jgi:RNase P subunit RPR2
MPYFPLKQPIRNFCSKHSREYTYYCPECAEEKKFDDTHSQDSKSNIPQNIVVEDNEDYKRLVCPDCNKPSLIYYKHFKKRECLNPDCPSKFNLSRDLTNSI